MTAKFAAALLLVAAVGTSAATHAAGDKDRGQAKAATCVACHGVDGNSVNPEWPSLAGQHQGYLVRHLKAFRDGERQNVLMSPMAMGLTDEDIQDLAAYFSAQTLRPTGETEPSKLALGQRLFRGGDAARGIAACSGCHGPAGVGNPGAGYASIKGQHAIYSAAQLRAYRSGERKTDPNQMMRSVAARLSDADIDALAAYIQGLR
jgi:cytochrome c553